MTFSKWKKAMLFLFVCAFVSFLLSGEAFAKITPKKADESTSVYVIQKGDTLSALAVKYFGSAAKWRNFEKYNEFSNINLILPGEKLQVPLSLEDKAKAKAEAEAEAEAEAKKKAEEEAKKAAAAKEMSAEQKEKMAELQKKLEAATAELKSLKASLEEVKDAEVKIKELKAANEKLHTAFIEKDKQVSELKTSIDNLKNTIQSAGQEVSKSIENALGASRGVSAQGVGRGEVEKIYKESEEISEKVSGLEAALKAQSGEISKVNSQIGSLQNALSAQSKEMPAEKEPKLSKKAKSAALITTLVGAAIWIVANAISSTK